jgi:P4 family phage/plasmid primase-like protien
MENENIELEFDMEDNGCPFGKINRNEVEKNFDNFMKKHSMKKDPETKKYDKDITHTCMGPPFGSYHIPDEEYDEFINLYKRVLLFREDLHVIERQKLIGPLLIDIDLRQEKKHRDRKYLEVHITKIIEYVVDIIHTHYNISKKNIESFVFEKDEPSFDQDKNNYKDGFHLVFPIPLHVGARAFITNEIKKKVKENKLFDDIPYINAKGLDEIFDNSVVWANGWFIYGSRKHTGKLYELTQIYDGYMNIITLEKYEQDELVSLLAIRQYTEDVEIKLRKSKNTPEIKVKLQEFTDSLVNKKKKKNDSMVNNVNDKLDKMNERFNNVLKPKPKSHAKKLEIQMAKELIQLLSPKRADSYEDWIRVCWALKNVDECLLPVFIEFSKKCKDKFNKEKCEEVWGQAHYNFTLASLFWWAKTDDPDGYTEFIRQNIDEKIREADTGTHDDLAKIMYEMYKFSYRCVSVKKNIWYEFQGHRWVQIDSGYTLAIKLSDELAAEFAKLSVVLLSSSGSDKKMGFGDTSDKKYFNGKKAINIIEKLKNEGFRNSVIAACAKRFLDSKFEEKLDDNKDLIGFENGVFDLRPECFGFRPGSPDDYISMSVGYDFKNFKDNDPQIMEIVHYFKTVQQEEDLRKYVLTLFASFLDGHNRNQKFILCTGSGCHASGTNIMMYDGSLKKVEKIKLGEEIMGDDSRPRKVINLFKGKEDMYTITLENGELFTVNKNHRLALRNNFKSIITEGKDIFDNDCFILSWYEYLSGDGIPVKMTKSFLKKDDAESFHKEIITENSNYINYLEVIPIIVYDYGKLISELEDIKIDFKMYSVDVHLEKEHIKNTTIDTYNNVIEKGIKDANKFTHVKLNKKLEYIAGLIDKYGKNGNNSYLLPKEVFNNSDIEYIIRTSNIRILFNNIDDNYIELIGNIPVKICNKIDVELSYDYIIKKVENVGPNMFYGFELDGNKRYVMGNMMVTYNSNGKSTSIDLMQYAMGQYFGILPTTVITVKHKNSSGARPELANKKGKRFLVIQEPEHDDVVYVGQMKNLTGSDWIETRALYGDPFMYKPQFKLILVCNKLPHIPANDGGTWRRLRVIPWESEFVDKPNPSNPKQIKKDAELIEKLRDWKQGFIWILLNKYYLDYRKNGIIEPPKVTHFTDKYKKDSDVYYEFMKDTYVITGVQKDYETVNTVHKAFVEWYRSQHGNQNIPSRKELVSYVQNMDPKIKIVVGNIRGIKDIHEVDDDDKVVDLGSKKKETNIQKQSKVAAETSV